MEGTTTNSIDTFFSKQFNVGSKRTADLKCWESNETVSGVYRYLGGNYGYSAQQAFLGLPGLPYKL